MWLSQIGSLKPLEKFERTGCQCRRLFCGVNRPISWADAAQKCHSLTISNPKSFQRLQLASEKFALLEAHQERAELAWQHRRVARKSFPCSCLTTCLGSIACGVGH